MSLIVSAIAQGFMWGILGIGVFLTFRILDFPDMSVEGTFPFGACVCVAALTHGASPLVATILSILAGMLAGLVTGLLYTKGKIPVLLAGILVMTGIYSVNLRVLGKSTLGLLNTPTLFSSNFLNSLPQYFNGIVLGGGLVIAVIVLLASFLNTELGQSFIATGDNEHMAAALGINTTAMKILGLVVSNGLIGLAGGVIAQSDGYADVNMGVGTIVIGLAAIIIGEVLFGELSLTARLVAVVFGSIGYRFVLLAVLQLGFSSDDFKLVSAIVLAICLMLPTGQAKLRALLKKGLTTNAN